MTISRVEPPNLDHYQRILWNRHPNTTCPATQQVYSCNVPGNSLYWRVIQSENNEILINPAENHFTGSDVETFTSFHRRNILFSNLKWDGLHLSMELTVPPLQNLSMMNITCFYTEEKKAEIIHILEGKICIILLSCSLLMC